jgi:uncharacterized protein YlxW (UPF0749 family)
MSRYGRVAWVLVAMVVASLAWGVAAVRAVEAVPSREAHVEMLLRQARELDEAGKKDQAAELRRKAENLTAQGREKEQPLQPQEQPAPDLEKRIRVLREMAGVADREEMPDAAHMFRMRAEALERELRERGPRPAEKMEARRALLEEAAQLRANAARAQEAGRGREADELRARAEDLEAKAREVLPEKERPREEQELRAEVRQLREEVGQLRKDIAELKATLKEARK